MLRKHRKKPNKKLQNVFILIVAVACVTFGLLGLYDYFKATRSGNPSISRKTVTHSTDTPDETPVSKACERYKTPSYEPRKITISSIDVSGCIQKVGIDQKEAIAVPSNIHLAGWFVRSVAPGEPGISIIDGHVSGKYEKGIFANLKKLQKNDTIAIEFGDGEKRQFTVADVSSYPAEETMQHVYKYDSDKPKLALITCGGRFNTQSQTYDKRVVVSSYLQ